MKRTHRSAMTLLEVTIVLLVVGLLSAVAAPKFSAAVRGSQVRAAAIQLGGHVSYLRRVAINEGRNSTLAISEANDLYSSADVDFPERIGTKILVRLKEAFDSSLELTADFDGAKFMTFDLEGVPHVGITPMISGTIKISSPGVESYHIVIAAGTGYVTVVSDSQIFPDSNTQANFWFPPDQILASI